MKRFLIMLILAFTLSICSNCYATPQYKQEGKNFVQTKSNGNKSKATKTDFTWEIDGIKYPIYISDKGKAFIKRISKKSGKEYNYYLPEEIAQQISKNNTKI